MTSFIQAVITGVLLGGVLALLCTGLTLIFGVMRVVNFAQADFMMVGMYAAIAIYQAIHLSPFISAIGLLLPIGAVAAYGVHWLIIGRASPTDATPSRAHFSQLIVTFGLSLVLQGLALTKYGSASRSLNLSVASSNWKIGALQFNQARVIAAAIAVALAVAVHVMLRHTKVGRLVRAAADDPEAATYSGVNVSVIHGITFGLGGGLAVAAGGVLVSYYPVYPSVSQDFIVLMFAAVVLGGLGSVPGALLGALIIGFVEGVAPDVLPLQVQSSAVFIVFLLVLFLRPQGILGKGARV